MNGYCQRHSGQQAYGICLYHECHFKNKNCIECMIEFHNSHIHKFIVFDMVEKKNQFQIKNILQDRYHLYQKIQNIVNNRTLSKDQVSNFIKNIQKQTNKMVVQILENCKQVLIENIDHELELLLNSLLSQVDQYSLNSNKYHNIMNEMFGLDKLISQQKDLIHNFNDSNLNEYVNRLKTFKQFDLEKTQGFIYEHVNDVDLTKELQQIQNKQNTLIACFKEMVEKQIITKIKCLSKGFNCKDDNMQQKTDKTLAVVNKQIKPILKISNAIDFESKFWENQQFSQSFERLEFNQSQVFPSFYNKFRSLIIETVIDRKINQVMLKKQDDSSLGEILKSSVGYQLEYQEGEDNPLKLLFNQEVNLQGYKQQVYWWINSMYFRIGSIVMMNDHRDICKGSLAVGIGFHKKYGLDCGTMVISQNSQNIKNIDHIAINIYGIP